jgi:hypothetical protein
MLWLAYVLLFLYGLAHTPILVDILRHFFPQWNIQRLTSSISSIILILLLTFFFLLSLGMQVFVFIQYVPLSPVEVMLHSIFAYWLWINAVTNYMYTLFSRPGIFRQSLKKNQVAPPSTGVVTTPITATNVSGTETAVGTQCALPKDKSYCKICQESIPYRDHHCPFTGNCIGLKNYSYFYLGLFYSMLGLGYSTSVIFAYFGDCIFLSWKESDTGDDMTDDAMREICVKIEPYSEMVFTTIGALVTVTVLVLSYTLMLLVDVSTYDVLKHWKSVKFDFRKYQGQKSRLRMLLLNQRAHPLLFLLPVRNSNTERS